MVKPLRLRQQAFFLFVLAREVDFKRQATLVKVNVK